MFVFWSLIAAVTYAGAILVGYLVGKTHAAKHCEERCEWRLAIQRRYEQPWCPPPQQHEF